MFAVIKIVLYGDLEHLTSVAARCSGSTGKKGLVMASIDVASNSKEDDEIAAEFDRRVLEGDRVEPSDWMPARYRKAVTRQMAQHAHSEWVGMLPEGGWLGRAPTLERKAILLAKVQDEAGHALYIYSAMETLGYSRKKAVAALHSGEARFSNAFHYPFLTWADVPVMGWLGDAAAIVNQVPLCRMSYAPYARAMVRVCKEENFHQRQGYAAAVPLANGNKDQRIMLQDAIDRWWWPFLATFGMPDQHSPHTEQAMKWVIKIETNDQLRQRYIDMVIPQIEELGFTVPDPELKWNEERKSYDSGQVRWEELKDVAAGRGPASRERLAARVDAHENGTWVREAATAFAEKKTTNQKAA